MHSIKQSDKHPQSEILLISMPFGLLDQPSIGLSLLQAHLQAADMPCATHYFTLPFAELIGAELYRQIADGEPLTVDQVGEWLFCDEVIWTGTSERRAVETDYIEQVLLGGHPAHRYTNPIRTKEIAPAFVDALLHARSLVSQFLDRCCTEVLAYKPTVVGFTTLFQQQLASLALAQRLKHARPDITIVFGGANCEGVMGAELVRQFHCVDVAVSGEADQIVVPLMQRLCARLPVTDIQGVYTYENTGRFNIIDTYANAPTVTDMDSLPYPDYRDYFTQLAGTQLDLTVNVLVETSRGCWWGELKHCIFCGLNDLGLGFRSKSAERAYAELLHLHTQYPDCPIFMVDNILDMRYFQTLLPRLIEANLGLQLFYEVKANLKKEQIRLLRAAGVTAIQPGIESLSTSILARMQKGVKAIQNIQLLKWCAELGVRPIWNFLWGFPGEEPAEYAAMEALIPSLTHLPPPNAAQHVHIDRFSPLFFAAERFGLELVRPYPSYTYIYPPMDDARLHNLAYYFISGDPSQEYVRSYVRGCAEQIMQWNRTYANSGLYIIDEGDDAYIWDMRPISTQLITKIDGLLRQIYLACDALQTAESLGTLDIKPNANTSPAAIHALVQPLIDARWMIREGNTYLSLAIQLHDRTGTQYRAFKAMYTAVDSIGRIAHLNYSEVPMLKLK